MYKTLALALAAAAAAMPAPQAASTVGAIPPKDQEFGIAMKFDDTYVALVAMRNGTDADYVLAGERLSVYTGTPAYFNASSSSNGNSSLALNLDIDGTAYGLKVPDVGDNYGYTATITAVEGYEEFLWSKYDGEIYHTLFAAPNGFYACNDTVNGDELPVLRFGDAAFNADGSGIPGCAPATLYINCNVEGSDYSCN